MLSKMLRTKTTTVVYPNGTTYRELLRLDKLEAHLVEALEDVVKRRAEILGSAREFTVIHGKKRAGVG
jgi:hypothetical protein